MDIFATPEPDIGPELGVGAPRDLSVLLETMRRKKAAEQARQQQIEQAQVAKQSVGGALTNRADAAPAPPKPQVSPPTASPSAEPGGIEARIRELESRSDALRAPPDYSALNQYAQERQQGGRNALLLALAAQNAGKAAAPVGEFMLKRAMAAQSPEKFTGGQVMDGKFVIDPGYGHEKEALANEAQLSRLYGQQDTNRTRMEAAREAAEMRRLIASEGNANRAAIAAMRLNAPRQMPAGLFSKLVTEISEGQDTVNELDASAAVLEKYGTEGGGVMRGAAATMLPGGIGTSVAQMGLPADLKNAEASVSHAMANPVHALYGAALTGNELASANMWRANPADNAAEKARKARVFSWYHGLGVFAKKKQLENGGVPAEMLAPEQRAQLMQEYVQTVGRPDPLAGQNRRRTDMPSGVRYLGAE